MRHWPKLRICGGLPTGCALGAMVMASLMGTFTLVYTPYQEAETIPTSSQGPKVTMANMALHPNQGTLHLSTILFLSPQAKAEHSLGVEKSSSPARGNRATVLPSPNLLWSTWGFLCLGIHLLVGAKENHRFGGSNPQKRHTHRPLLCQLLLREALKLAGCGKPRVLETGPVPKKRRSLGLRPASWTGPHGKAS